MEIIIQAKNFPAQWKLRMNPSVLEPVVGESTDENFQSILGIENSWDQVQIGPLVNKVILNYSGSVNLI